MRDDVAGDAANAFGAVAEAYQRGRPPYPAAALDWLLPAGADEVLDLGAGTGKLTASLVARGLAVSAVEPDLRMLQVLRREVPTARAHQGRAEAIPLPDACVDAVLVAQAWHWVDPARAIPEIARVLRPGGRLGLLWNLRDERTDWVARLGAILRPAGAVLETQAHPDTGTAFGPLEHTTVQWSHEITGAALADLVASRSYVIALPPRRRAELLERVRALVKNHPDVSGSASFALPYVTDCFRADLAH